MEIRWDQWKSHAKCANSGWSILLHPDFWDTLGSTGRIMGNQAWLDHQVRDWSGADPGNMDNIIVILDTNSHYIPLIMKPRESSRPTCWDQISVWGDQRAWGQRQVVQCKCFGFNLRCEGVVQVQCPNRVRFRTLDKWQVFWGYLAIMPWDILCFWGGWSGITGVEECFFRFFRHSMYSWRLSYMTSRLWQAAWDLTPGTWVSVQQEFPLRGW